MNNQITVAEKEVKPAQSKIFFEYQRLEAWKEIDLEDWEDWHWQVKNRITTKEQLARVIKLTAEEESGIQKGSNRLPMAVTPYWTTLMDPLDPNCPIRKQSVPVQAEFSTTATEMADPCGEDKDSPVPGLVHRYPDRVLLLATEQCAMYCRHCTRRRLVGDKKHPTAPNRFDAAYDYIRSNRKIRDVLISGGDPFMLEDNKLEEIIKNVRSIGHVEFLRIGTRVPVTLPQRVTEDFVKMLKKYSPLWISLHFNHPKEITKRCKLACSMLVDSGFPLGSQTVLLKGINDKPYLMKKLMHELLQIRVRPYYIYQCDPAQGTAHFRTPVATGINIIEKLRGHTSGYAVPVYVIDAPGGGGKIPIGPQYIVSQEKGRCTLRNFRGDTYTYIDPES